MASCYKVIACDSQDGIIPYEASLKAGVQSLTLLNNYKTDLKLEI